LRGINCIYIIIIYLIVTLFTFVLMGNNIYHRISFSDVNFAIQQVHSGSFIIINTLPINQQHCLIKNTLPCENEEATMNDLLINNKLINIIVYGKNANDMTVEKKCIQLCQIGFKNIYCYVGGLYQWLLHQDIYGEENFPTTTKCSDMLMYKECDHFTTCLLK
jgi:hypothetical protein